MCEMIGLPLHNKKGQEVLVMPCHPEAVAKVIEAAATKWRYFKMKIIVCFRHLKCICRKGRRGMDYSWHVQHLLREFGRGQFADLHSIAGR
jgi:hypothetical protein